MTADKIKAFVARLLQREVGSAELSELSRADLVAINIYLLEYRRACSRRRIIQGRYYTALPEKGLDERSPLKA